MKITQRFEVAPTALHHFMSSLNTCSCSVKYDDERDMFIIDVSRETTYYELQMDIIARIRDIYESDTDEYNALNEGISALKTINDMEVNK